MILERIVSLLRRIDERLARLERKVDAALQQQPRNGAGGPSHRYVRVEKRVP